MQLKELFFFCWQKKFRALQTFDQDVVRTLSDVRILQKISLLSIVHYFNASSS